MTETRNASPDTEGMKASSGRNETLTPPINDCGEGEPVGYFQHNAAWNAWEQVAQEFAGQEGVTALYAAPSPKGKADGEAVRVLRRVLECFGASDFMPTRDFLDAILDAEQVLAALSNPAQALPDGEVLPTGEMLAAGRDALEPYVGALKQPVSDQWQLARDVWSAMSLAALSKPSSRNGDTL